MALRDGVVNHKDIVELVIEGYLDECCVLRLIGNATGCADRLRNSAGYAGLGSSRMGTSVSRLSTRS